MVQMSAKTNVCILDNASYAALSKKWGKNRSLKVWWDKLPPVEQVDWYNKQQQVPAGTKRKFDEITYRECSTNSVDNVDNEMDHFKTWTQFLRDGINEGKNLLTLEKEWADLTEGPHTEAIWVRNQWLVPEFNGVMRGRETRNGQRQDIERSVAVASSEQLTTLVAQGQALLNQYSNSIAPAMQQTPAQPTTNASVGDQPTTTTPTDIMLQQAHREASLVSQSQWTLFF